MLMRIYEVELKHLRPYADALGDRRKVTTPQTIQAQSQFLDAAGDRRRKISSMMMIQMILRISQPKVMSLKEMNTLKKIGRLVRWLGD
jgi:hypothetical protein